MGTANNFRGAGRAEPAESGGVTATAPKAAEPRPSKGLARATPPPRREGEPRRPRQCSVWEATRKVYTSVATPGQTEADFHVLLSPRAPAGSCFPPWAPRHAEVAHARPWSLCPPSWDALPLAPA